ncbi:MAG: urea transporter [Chitinophagaceae bacterium]|nr:urea transporter [Chitinophagaceae bacterium]
MKRTTFILFLSYITTSVLNSYSMLFFSNNKFFASVVFLITFFNPYTGLAGFIASLVAVLVAYFIGFSREQVKSGLYTYSAVLVGWAWALFMSLVQGSGYCWH